MSAEKGTAEQKQLQDLLKLSIKYSEAESKPLQETEIDEERKEFLQKALADAADDDDYKKLVLWNNQFLQYKADGIYNEQQLEEISNVFEGLNFLLEGMDVSIDFDKLGGLKHCILLLRSKYSSIQWRAADTIANSVQNIPQNQYSIIEDKGFETLLFVLKKTDVDVVKVKCLYALSCLLGANTVGQKLFLDLKGLDVIVKHLSHENVKVRLKSCLLLRKIAYSETARFITNKVDIARQLISGLKMDHDDSHEVFADVLLNFIQNDENTRNDCQRGKELSGLLPARIEKLKDIDADRYQDLVETYNQILQLL